MAIEVIITDTTSGDRTPVSTRDEPQGTSKGQPVSQKKKEKETDRGVAAAGLVGLQQIMPYVNTAINFGVSQIQVQTGSAELQQRAQIVTSVTSTAVSIGMGAAIGGVGGAAVAAAMQALQGAISFVQNSITINTQQRMEAENIRLKTSRIGMTVNRSRTGGVT